MAPTKNNIQRTALMILYTFLPKRSSQRLDLLLRRKYQFQLNTEARNPKTPKAAKNTVSSGLISSILQYASSSNIRSIPSSGHSELILFALLIFAHYTKVLEHFLHFLKLSEKSVYIRNGISAACRYSPFTAGIDY